MDMPTPLTIWCNVALTPAVTEMLDVAVSGHTLIAPSRAETSNLVAGAVDPGFGLADVAFGQPHPDGVRKSTRLKWVHLSSAGYTRYDTPVVREHARDAGVVFTNSSSVYDEPCAQHVLAMMLTLSRQLPAALDDQRRGSTWPYLPLRQRSVLLEGQTVLVVGYGAIGRRLAQLLTPFNMNVVGFRRTPVGTELVPVRPIGELDTFLPRADHVINILPAASGTERFFGATRFSLMKPAVRFYNIGRGSTVVQTDLVDALVSGHLASAYVDVTDPEPLPPDHPMWTTPNLHITPHTAGGHHDELERLVRHFQTNLTSFLASRPLRDRIF